MKNKRVEKLREASREVKVPVTGNLDREKAFVFDQHKEVAYVIAEIPVRTIQVGTKSTTQRFDELSRVFVLTVDDFEEHFEHNQRFKNTSRVAYVILHDPLKGDGKAVPLDSPKAKSSEASKAKSS